eukprot:8293636-Prorocentrum_lima.AAC.1
MAAQPADPQSEDPAALDSFGATGSMQATVEEAAGQGDSNPETKIDTTRQGGSYRRRAKQPPG